MTPSARRQQILDSAAALIVEKGLLSCTLEETAVRAGISKPLIYRYFAKREDMLVELMEREYDFLLQRGVLNSLPADSFEPMVKHSYRRMLDYLYERGPILRLMASDPTLRKSARLPVERGRLGALKQVAKRCQQFFQVPDEVSLIATMLAANAPVLTARFLQNQNIPAAAVADVWAEFTIGGWKALSERYGRKDGRNGPAPVSGGRNGRTSAPARRAA